MAGFRPFKRQLGAGGQDRLDQPGDTIYLQKADGPVRFATLEGDELVLEPGSGGRINPFNYILCYNENPTTNEFIVQVGSGDYYNNQFTGDVTVDSSPSKPVYTSEVDAWEPVNVVSATGAVSELIELPGGFEYHVQAIMFYTSSDGLKDFIFRIVAEGSSLALGTVWVGKVGAAATSKDSLGNTGPLVFIVPEGYTAKLITLYPNVGPGASVTGKRRAIGG